MQQPGPPPPGGYNPNVQPGMQRPPGPYNMAGPPPLNSGPPKPGQIQGMAPPGGPPKSGQVQGVGLPGGPPPGPQGGMYGQPNLQGPGYRGPRPGGPYPGQGQYPGNVPRTGQPGGPLPPPSSSNSNQYGPSPPMGAQPPSSRGPSFDSRVGPPPSSNQAPRSSIGQSPPVRFSVGPPPPNGTMGPDKLHITSGQYALNAHNRFAPSAHPPTNYQNGSQTPPAPSSNNPPTSSNYPPSSQGIQPSQRLPMPNTGPPTSRVSPVGPPPPSGAQSPPSAGMQGPPRDQLPGSLPLRPTIGALQQDSRPGSAGDQNTSLNSSPGPPSARSSAAPSPIPSQQYDSLEGGLPYFPNAQGGSVSPGVGFPQPGQFTPPSSSYAGPPTSLNYGGPPPPPTSGSQYLGPPPPGGHPSSMGPPPMGGAPPQMGPPPTGISQYPGGPPPSGGPPQMGGPPQVGQNYIGAPPAGPPTGPPMGPPTSTGISGRRQYPVQPSYMNSVSPQPGSGMTQPPTSAAQQPGSYHSSQPGMNNISAGMDSMKLQDGRMTNLLQERHIVQPTEFKPPKAKLHPDYQKIQVSPDVFRSTLTSIPESQTLLQKSKLPLGLIIHPFRDLSHLPVIQSSVIVRCRSCRTYINPFVAFIDQRRWRCNLCFRVNDLPEEFTFDPVTKTYGDPQRRPEIKSATIEFIAPSEYMLRPPQPAVYLFLLDVSFSAVECGYLSVICQVLLDCLEKIPGDARTLVGFITFDSTLHFYSLQEGATRPQMMVVSDIDDVFLPCPSDLLVNVHESKELICELLNQLPAMFVGNTNTQTALGPALQAALKLMSATGGRVTVFQCSLPSAGAGALKSREDPNQRATGKNVPNLGPATDFYKKLALDFSGHQIAADIFLLGGQYMDIATLAGISKFSGGSISYYPAFHTIQNSVQAERLESDFKRYLTRKIGFEAVMRIRCTKGMSIHTFHGNFFVRSTDLLSLPNISPDAGFAMQVSIEDNLNSSTLACFQAALLYTSSKGERRIRVHTMCLPITNQLTDVFVGADAQAITGLLSRMAVDKCQTTSMGDARDALVNVCIDFLSSYKMTLSSSHAMGALMCPPNLRMLPLYMLALLKNVAFRLGTSTKLDARVFAMEMFKCMPVMYNMLHIHPDLYPVHNLTDDGALLMQDQAIPQPELIGLSSEYVSRDGAYLMDVGDIMYLFIGKNVSPTFCQEVLDVPDFASIPQSQIDLPDLNNPTSERLRLFINWLLEKRPYHAPLLVISDDSKDKGLFLRYLVQDRSEGAMSYYEFIQHLQKEVK